MSALASDTISADACDMRALFAAHDADGDTLYGRYCNAQLVRLVKAVGYDVGFTRGEGAYLYDRRGERYLDLLSGFGVFAIGRAHPAVRAALASVLDSDLPNLVQMEPPRLAAVLAQRLLAFAPYLDKAFFANSGGEAAEVAIKFARYATGRSGIVYCDDAFHGVSYGALSINGDESFRQGFGPFVPDCTRIPFNDLAALDRVLSGGGIAAFIVEPIQGHGVNVPAPDYLKEAAALCHRHGALFVADEIQTGLGRTGRFLAVEHWNAEPDIVLLSKALSGGYVPVSAILMRKSIYDRVIGRIDRALVAVSTFGENNLAMAAGIATLDVIASERLIERAAATGARLMRAFEDMAARYELVSEVRGKGMMLAIDFARPSSLALRTQWDLIERARTGLFAQLITLPLFADHRILSQVAGTDSHAVKFLPPLALSDADADWLIEAVDAVIAAAHRVPGGVWSLGRRLIGNMVGG